MNYTSLHRELPACRHCFLGVSVLLREGVYVLGRSIHVSLNIVLCNTN